LSRTDLVVLGFSGCFAAAVPALFSFGFSTSLFVRVTGTIATVAIAASIRPMLASARRAVTPNQAWLIVVSGYACGLLVIAIVLWSRAHGLLGVAWLIGAAVYTGAFRGRQLLRLSRGLPRRDPTT
jgi:uncharacterized membrane protein YdbT with pleckstrin-like domain